MVRQHDNTNLAVDELLDHYLSWREECVALDAAYDRWARATTADRALAFAVYVAQLDLEEHAAKAYQRSTKAAMSCCDIEQLAAA